jgi:hypothetical protein
VAGVAVWSASPRPQHFDVVWRLPSASCLIASEAVKKTALPPPLPILIVIALTAQGHPTQRDLLTRGLYFDPLASKRNNGICKAPRVCPCLRSDRSVMVLSVHGRWADYIKRRRGHADGFSITDRYCSASYAQLAVWCDEDPGALRVRP